MHTQSKPPAARRLLPYADATEYLGGISRRTLATLVAAGKVQTLLVSPGRRVFDIEDLDAYIKQQKRQGI